MTNLRSADSISREAAIVGVTIAFSSRRRGWNQSRSRCGCFAHGGFGACPGAAHELLVQQLNGQNPNECHVVPGPDARRTLALARECFDCAWIEIPTMLDPAAR